MKENNLQDFKPIKGILISSGCLGLYDNKRNDISLISLETDATVCGYFTQNIYRSATVVISENNIKENSPKYIIVNAGNANACTGYEGELDIKNIVKKFQS